MADRMTANWIFLLQFFKSWAFNLSKYLFFYFFTKARNLPEKTLFPVWGQALLPAAVSRLILIGVAHNAASFQIELIETNGHFYGSGKHFCRPPAGQIFFFAILASVL